MSEHKEGHEDIIDQEPAELEHEPTNEPEKESNGREVNNGRGPRAKVIADDEESEEELDPEVIVKMEVINNTEPSTELEIAMSEILKRKEHHITRLTQEITKLKGFISKRKQTYKRKRKDEGAPTRALSAYNIFVQERFARLAKDNENALKSDDADAKLKRVPPANLVASTGNEWKELTAQDKEKYEVE
jgi:CHAT domain-containing protein